MSTKVMIRKVLAEVEAHEERGWLKGYEQGLATREKQVVDLGTALEAKNQKIRELSHQKKGPTTAREALDLAWDLAYPVKEGQEVQVGTELIARFEDGDFRTYRAKKPFEGTSEPGWAETRTLDPLPDPEPDWLDAPAVLAAPISEGRSQDRTVFVRENSDGTQWVRDTRVYRWDELTDVTPLYPKGQEA